MSKNKITDIVFILDRSGSMHAMEADTIGGYNSYIADFKDKNSKITTVLFDNEYEMITKREDINKVTKLTKKEYYVRGCTALMDAIGNSIEFMEKEKAEKVIFVITTDGYENASRKYTKEQIKEMIKGHSNWEFMYVGADIDSYSEAESIGIERKNVANYKKSSSGTSKMFKAMSKATEDFYLNDSVDVSWKKELE